MKRIALALTLAFCFALPTRAGDVHIPPDCPLDGACTNAQPFVPLAELYGDAAVFAVTQ